ncbi:MAG: hypothetical protein ACPLRP_03185 [Candidatus Bipolaricaulaceae bacterium]
MSSFFFTAADFLRANLRGLGGLFLWSLSVGLVLLSLLVTLGLPPSQPAGPAESHRFFLLTLSPLLSEKEINRLAWEVWAWPGVARVSFRFPGEDDPEPIKERTILVEAEPGSAEGMAAKLQKLPGVTKVTEIERTVVPGRVPSSARIGAILALIVSSGLSLFLGAREMGQASLRWSREEKLLRESGAPRIVWQGPKFVFAGLAGLLGVGFYMAALLVGTRFVQPDSVWAALMKLDPKAIALGVPVGLLLGFLAALLGLHS